MAENTLLAALNGWHGSKVSDAKISELRRNLMLARKACEEQGVEAETLWDFVQKQRQIHEAYVRRYANEQLEVAPVLPFRLRQGAAGAAAILLAVAVLLGWPTPGGMCSALVAALLGFAAVEGVLSELFPTPAVRIARMACEFAVDVSDLWAQGSNELKDYVRGYKRHERRLAQRGEPTGWIKAR